MSKSSKLALVVCLAVVSLPLFSAQARAATSYHILRFTSCSAHIDAYGYDLSADNGVLKSVASEEARIVCGFRLPDDATITLVTAHGDDGDNVDDISFKVYKARYDASSPTAIDSFTSDDTSNSWSSASLSEAVNNSLNTYFVVTKVPSDGSTGTFELWNLEIKYTTP